MLFIRAVFYGRGKGQEKGLAFSLCPLPLLELIMTIPANLRALAFFRNFSAAKQAWFEVIAYSGLIFRHDGASAALL